MRSILLLFILAAVMAAQPITFHIPPDTGLTVIPANDAGFESAVQPFFANPRSQLQDFGGMARACSMIVHNTSGQDVRLITLRWVQTIGNHTLSDVTTFRFVRDFVQPTLHQDQTALLFPREAVFGANVAMTAGKPQRWDNYLNASHIDVYLDAVVYADWHLVGPDIAGSNVMLAAQRQAILDTERDLSIEIRAGRSTIALAEKLHQLHPVQTFSIPESVKDYAYQYARTRQALGSLLLHSGADARSHAALIKGLSQQLPGRTK